MVSAGEVFAIAAMFGGASIAILCLDFLQRNLPDSLGEQTPWGDIVELPDEARAPTRKSWGREGCVEQGPIRTTSEIAPHGKGL
jgi:hypothetical protein